MNKPREYRVNVVENYLRTDAKGHFSLQDYWYWDADGKRTRVCADSVNPGMRQDIGFVKVYL